jgi:hypothetical protein
MEPSYFVIKTTGLRLVLLAVVAVRCRKLISTLSWIVGGLFGLFERKVIGDGDVGLNLRVNFVGALKSHLCQFDAGDFFGGEHFRCFAIGEVVQLHNYFLPRSVTKVHEGKPL